MSSRSRSQIRQRFRPAQRSAIPIRRRLGGASIAYLAGVLRIGFGTYFEAFMLVGLLCIAAALMVLFIGTGRRGVAEPATAKAYS